MIASILFVTAEILVALGLRSLSAFLSVLLFRERPPMELAILTTLITSVATLAAIWIIGFFHLKYIKRLHYAGLAVLASAACLIAALTAASFLNAFVFERVPLFATIVIGQLPLAGAVIGFNFFLFKRERQIF